MPPIVEVVNKAGVDDDDEDDDDDDDDDGFVPLPLYIILLSITALFTTFATGTLDVTGLSNCSKLKLTMPTAAVALPLCMMPSRDN